MGKFAEVVRAVFRKGMNYIVSEIYRGDTSNAFILTPSGVETIPIRQDKVLLIGTDKNGQKVALGVPLSAEIVPGEIRLKARKENGEVVSYIYQKQDGIVEIGKEDFKRLVNESFKDLYNSHKHSGGTIQGMTGTPDPLTSLMTDAHLTKKVKGE